MLIDIFNYRILSCDDGWRDKYTQQTEQTGKAEGVHKTNGNKATRCILYQTRVLRQMTLRQTILLNREGRLTILCVIQDGHFIVIEVNSIHQCVDQSLSILDIVDVAILEFVQKEPHFLYSKHMMLGGLLHTYPLSKQLLA